MYDPIYDIVAERQSKMRQAAETSHMLASLRKSNLGLRQRLAYNLGGMLIAFGTRLRESTPEPCTEPASPVAYSMTESC